MKISEQSKSQLNHTAEPSQTQRPHKLIGMRAWRCFLTGMAAVISVVGTLLAKTIADPGGSPLTPAAASDCRQSLMRLVTLSTTRASADDIKTAVQNETVGCMATLEKVRP